MGKLECSGNLPFQGFPTSCEDLQKIGHSLSGINIIRKNNQFEYVYCDMSKLPGDKGNGYMFIVSVYLKEKM